MKTKTAILTASIIACATGYSAQETDPEKERTTEPTKVCREASGTNELIVLRPAGQAFSHDGSNVWIETTHHGAESDSSGENTGSPLAVLSPTPSGDEVASASTRATESDASVFGNLTGNKILDWIPRPQNTNTVSRKKGGAQLIVFDPESDLNGTIQVPEYKDLIPPPPALHEWVKPSVFLAKWVDFWINGTDATPVVLVFSTF